MVLTARRAGVCDELVGCRITGMTHPLGFRLKALGKGVVVAFDTLHDAQPLPRYTQHTQRGEGGMYLGLMVVR